MPAYPLDADALGHEAALLRCVSPQAGAVKRPARSRFFNARHALGGGAGPVPLPLSLPLVVEGSRLQEGWVIANHILVSFHIAFISSVLSIPSAQLLKSDVLKFIFVSPETLVSAMFMYISFHTGIAVHELGHYVTAARLNALNDKSQRDADRVLSGAWPRRLLRMVQLFVLAPYGQAQGIKREALNYYPDAPYNLAVAAAGPRTSRNLAVLALTPAVILLFVGIRHELAWAIYAGRLCLGMGVVGLLDYLLADPGKYAEFKRRERLARERAASVEKAAAWWEAVGAARQIMLKGRMQELMHPRLGPVTAPWQFRNCGMGGRHTEKEYPESNISMQEAMFLILGARDYQEAQEMTVRLQNRLKELIEKEEGCRVMGIGLEGGLAPYIERGPYPLPEVRLWALMTQTIRECGYRPGEDVAIALDPAMSELETAYRTQYNVPDSVGMYLFWRDKALTVMDRDGVLELYQKAIQDYDIPILSIEDGFSEDDYEGWQKLLSALGDRVFVIGDDLVTTNDHTIEVAAAKGLINTALIKANQIGTLYETLLAMLVSLGKGLELVVSHRSKSPNDDMEAQIALAVNSLGLKCGGGANTERLVKYHTITQLMRRGAQPAAGEGLQPGLKPVVRRIYAYEEPTNAGIPSVGATVELELAEQGIALAFKGATPLGTSAGTGEAIHLVDSAIEASEHREVIGRHKDLFRETEPGVYAFQKQVKEQQVKSTGDEDLLALFARAGRYEGKGCLNAVDNVSALIAPVFEGTLASDLTLKDIDRLLLSLEVDVARRRGKLAPSAAAEEVVHAMQRKQNLGMNAILSVSLAMARAVAHLQGKQLYELLREELFSIIQQLAGKYGVDIEGGRFADYARALVQVNAILAREGRPLYQALRDLSGIYEEQGLEARPRVAESAVLRTQPAKEEGAGRLERAGERAARGLASPAASPPALKAVASPMLTEEEQASVVALNRRLRDALREGVDTMKRREVLRGYVAFKQSVTERAGPFGLVNNRLYRTPDDTYVPYLFGNRLLVYRAGDHADGPIAAQDVREGAILTDEVIQRIAGFAGEPIDLESELFELDTNRCPSVRVARVRDITEQLQRIQGSVNRNEAVYLLRILVARLSLFSFKKYLSAKNLKSEVHTLVAELLSFLNTPLSFDLPLLVRILVRNISGVVVKPKLIDRLWNDTIDLAEVHLRGSDIVNEIRRSTHHAVGKRTLLLVESYLDYLETGSPEGLSRLGYPEPGPADVAARGQKAPREIVARIRGDLEELLGSSDVINRLRDWQVTYAAALPRCESDDTLQDEVAKVVENSIGQRNRWTYYHHLRIIRNRVAQFPRLPQEGRTAEARLHDLLQLQPDAPDFNAARVTSELKGCVNDFLRDVKAAYQEGLFGELDVLMTDYDRRAYYETFVDVFELRQQLRGALRERAFPEQRLLLYELDCLLEEMNYVALRHVASGYEEGGLDLPQCLDVIRRCALNLTHDGLHSRQVVDLALMLTDETATYAEVRNVLEHIQRNYLHTLRRVIAPFERMRDRLELDAEELRIALANMQRFLHDLNSMAYFTDLARAHIERTVGDQEARIHGRAASPGDVPEPGQIVHLSHREQIGELVTGTDAACNLRSCYGGKGSGLIYISHLSMPTSDGFIIPCSAAKRRAATGDDTWLVGALREHVATLEGDIARCEGVPRRFGQPEHPLLLAVRGGSVFSMPGMLTTVLFAGINDRIALRLADLDPWHAYDSYRRFLASYAQAAWKVDVEKYSLVDAAKERYGVKYKQDLPWEAMREIALESKQRIEREGYGEALSEVLEDPQSQLVGAVRAVMDSWDSETARRYRALKGICDSWHTAVIVQVMASGNHSNSEIKIGMDETRASLTGVIPRTVVTDLGVREITGEFKFSASGDDLVGGLTTSESFRSFEELGSYMPMLNRRLRHTVARLRRFMGTDQEIEFTVDRGVLSVLQSRAAEVGKNRENPSFSGPGDVITHGIGIRGSAFRGVVAFDEADYQELRAGRLENRQDVDGILIVLENPTPADIPLVISCEGLLAAKGGSTSHAAIAINGIEDADYTAVMSADGLHVNAQRHEATITGPDGRVKAQIRKGDVVSIDGTGGAVYLGSRTVART